MKHMLRLIDRFCLILCGASVALIGFSFMYEIVRLLITGDLGRPSLGSWIGLLGGFAAMTIFAGTHVVTWTLPEWWE